MKTTIVSIVLASILGLMYCSNPSMAVTQKPEDKELRALLTKRRDHLQLYYKAVSSQMRVAINRDMMSIRRMVEARELLVRAELDLANLREERIALLERALAEMLEIKDLVAKRATASDDLYLLESECVRLEIELHKTRKAE